MPVLRILWNISRMLITPIGQIGRSAGSSQSGEKIRRQRHLVRSKYSADVETP